MKRHPSSSSSSISSSANPKKLSAAPKGAAFIRRKKPTNARSPLQDLNGVVTCRTGTNVSTSSSSCTSASTSIEAPRGCLRFFLSNPSSSVKPKTPNRNRPGALPGTPKSAPAPKPCKNPTKCSGKSKTCLVSGDLEVKSLKEKQDFELGELDLCGVSAANCTPVSKITGGSGLGLGTNCRVDGNNDDSGSKIKTPPIEASVSPEIQCGGLDVLKTASMASGKGCSQPCYGAGHVLSGITDKRKCRPRGVLTFRDNHSENADACGNDGSGVLRIGKTSGLSPIPLPCTASINWLSPCHEEGEKDQKGKSPAQGLQDLVSASLSSSPFSLSGTGFSSDVFSTGSLTSSATDASTSTSRMGGSAPRYPSQGGLDFQGFAGTMFEIPSPSHMTPIFSNSTSNEQTKCIFYDEKEGNAFSTVSFGSGNVIQTPKSDSSSKVPSEDQVHYEDSLLARAFDKVALSPEHHHHHLSTWDPADLSFRFNYLNMPCNSIDLAQLQKIVDSKAASWVSNSTSDFMLSQDPLRISWRDGLASRIFEMDKYDSCRCFSDEEEEEDPNVKPHPSPQQSSGTSENTKPGNEQEVEMDSHVQSMSLESTISNRDRLTASDDSSWNLCYKNRLFEGYSRPSVV